MKNGMITSSAIVIVILGIRIGFVWAKKQLSSFTFGDSKVWRLTNGTVKSTVAQDKAEGLVYRF